MRSPLPLVHASVRGALRRRRHSRADHQSDSGADREAWPERRGQGRGAPARYARAAPRRSGRRAGRLGARQLRPRPSGRPPVRQRLARVAVPARSASNQPSVYANVGAAFPLAVYNRLESGFIGFDFHPEFARNGLFYTVHAERAMGNPATPNFIPPGFTPADVNYHNIITEWRATNPTANTFEGTRRELLRVGPHRHEPHPSDSAISSSTRRRSRGRPTTVCSTRAAAIWGSATAGDRMRTIPARRSASTRSSAPFCASTRAVRRCPRA